jgi:hypothetical protein
MTTAVLLITTICQRLATFIWLTATVQKNSQAHGPDLARHDHVHMLNPVNSYLGSNKHTALVYSTLIQGVELSSVTIMPVNGTPDFLF